LLYRFQACVLDTGRRELRRGGTLVAVEPQVFDLLELLIRSRERVVSRDDLLAVVWRGRIVSEATMSSRLNSARAAIGDNGENQSLIRTLPRRGFRFVGEVEEEPDRSNSPKLEAVLESVRPRLADPEGPSIAILPFTNMSGDPEQGYFADGMAEDITTALSRCSGLFVIARNSAFTYRSAAVDIRRVGRELGVGYVLKGSVRRSGRRLRISGQLIDAVSGAHLWAERYDGDMEDVFELQDRITESVVAAIEPTLRFAEIERRKSIRPNRLDAYDLLLRAYSLELEFTPESLAAALACLDQALAIEPFYAQAMAAASYCHALRHFQGWMHEDDGYRTRGVNLAWGAVDRAPGDAQVLWMAAFAIWNMAGEGREAAVELFSRSLLINPNSATALSLAGWIETMRGNTGPGREMLERSRRLSPRDPRGWFTEGSLAITAIAEEDYPRAALWAEKALVLNRRYAVALRALAVALVNMGQRERAATAIANLLEVEPELTISGFFERIPFPAASMARTYAEALRAAGLPE
jgi:TolB-like protein